MIPNVIYAGDLFILETALLIGAIFFALFIPGFGGGIFERIERALLWLARRPVLSLIVIGIAPLALRALVMGLWPPPAMHVHDEYSYLLTADTFAHGRLTNPPHPLWHFFESIHLIQQPTYNGMYQPGQAAFLALGQILTGAPWFGVAISTGLMCSALLWMLRGLFSPGWAFFGASIAVVRIGIFSYWMSDYWGGSVAALGGALAAGATIRLLKKPNAKYAAILGTLFALGLVTLANTRPYEGGLFAIPLVAAFLWKYKSWKPFWARTLIPLVTILAAGAAFDLYYDWRVTGDPFKLPQMLQREQYAVYGYGAFSPAHPVPAYRHAPMRDFYTTAEARSKSYPRNLWDVTVDFVHREKVLFWFFLGPVLLLPVLLGTRALRSKKLLVVGLAFLATTAGLAWLPWPINSHYYAPVTCAIYAYLILAMRHIRYSGWKQGKTGVAMVRAVAVICVAMLGIRAMAEPLGVTVFAWPQSWSNASQQDWTRARMLDELRERPEKTLVIVRYKWDHDPDNEWVYNEADIDHAKVVWAREMDSGNQKLLDYFKDRRILLLEPDYNPDRLVPYILPDSDKQR